MLAIKHLDQSLCMRCVIMVTFSFTLRAGWQLRPRTARLVPRRWFVLRLWCLPLSLLLLAPTPLNSLSHLLYHRIYLCVTFTLNFCCHCQQQCTMLQSDGTCHEKPAFKRMRRTAGDALYDLLTELCSQ